MNQKQKKLMLDRIIKDQQSSPKPLNVTIVRNRQTGLSTIEREIRKLYPANVEGSKEFNECNKMARLSTAPQHKSF